MTALWLCIGVFYLVLMLFVFGALALSQRADAGDDFVRQLAERRERDADAMFAPPVWNSRFHGEVDSRGK